MKYLWINFLFISLVMTTSCVSRVKSISSELVYEAKAVTGEGSIWHPSRHTLFWVDIEGQTLYEYHPADKTCSSWRFDRMISTVVPETDTTVVVALQDEIVRVHLSDGHTASIAPIPDDGGKLRCNDGKCDPAGRLWVGTMGFGAPKEAGTLYCVLPDGEVVPKLRKVTISNGIVWTSDKQYMYYNDTPTGRIARYRYDAASGEISFDGIAVVLPEGSGSPDGNASFGALQGTPGHNLGENYHLQVQRPTCPKSGTLRISIVVRRDGTVKEARYVSGTGEAAADASIRKQFEDFTKKLRFTVSGNAPAEKRGTITWEIK